MTETKKKAGAPIGNRNSAKGRTYADAIRKAVMEIDPIKKRKKLTLIAEKVVDKAMHGDNFCIHEVGDRLDGKAPQAIEIGGDLGREINKIEYVIVDPRNATEIKKDWDDAEPITADEIEDFTSSDS